MINIEHWTWAQWYVGVIEIVTIISISFLKGKRAAYEYSFGYISAVVLFTVALIVGGFFK